MNVERYFKLFCFGLAALQLFLIYYDLSIGKAQAQDYLINVGVILMCIEMGILMTHEQLSAKVSFQSIFLLPKDEDGQDIVLSSIGVWATSLGKVGFSLWILGLILSFI